MRLKCRGCGKRFKLAELIRQDRGGYLCNVCHQKRLEVPEMTDKQAKAFFTGKTVYRR